MKILFLNIHFFFLTLPILQAVVVHPLDILTPYRMDVMAKYIYAKYRELNAETSWAQDLYREHLHVWINFIDREKNTGRPDKTHYIDFEKSFNAVLDSIKNNDFNASKSILPYGVNGITNGAHRLASCLLYDKPITIETKHNNRRCRATANFFLHRKKFTPTGLHEDYVDHMCLQYILLKKNISLLICFNVSKKQIKEIVSLCKKLGDFITKKKIILSPTGFKNITKSCQTKYKFPTKDHQACHAFFWEHSISTSAQEKLIQNSMNKFNVSSSSYYIINRHKKVIKYAQICFNKNSIGMINQYLFSKQFKSMINAFKQIIKNQGRDLDLFCLKAKILNPQNNILSYYFHEENPLSDNLNNNFILKPIEKYNDNSHHDKFIFNPNFYFFYKGVKISI